MSFQRRKFLAALLRAGAVFVREGGGHTIVRGSTGRQTAIPRHTEINRVTARKIAKQLDIDWSVVEEGMS